ncbi:Crp/Fnr family transcriptional regulator [Actinocorallia sp. API 0066]|uniref:Crp/Fnr family transcriptional regulator n=1 Tax=Actinocorallia sp. API 0066 TaxID=2896846 RepID=UPI001E4A3195|nr:Crp/Fnr family transcriptional regulator [Actinocorallia sp. API 0066]MCD0452458.1 Crp/Fnr family transcriptional regulator [Actinocorallia sp. API 0066]
MTRRTGSWPPKSLMAALTDEERTALLRLGTEIEFPHRTNLVTQGDTKNDELYVLLDGVVLVTVNNAEGEETTLTTRSRGDLIGEFAVLDDSPRTATVTAVTTVVALRIGRTAFKGFVTENTSVYEPLVVSVLAKTRSNVARRAELRTWDARKRLANMLWELADEHGVPTDEGRMIELFTQSEIGSLAGAREATTERHLREFRIAGLIRTRWHKVVVVDMDGLAAVWRE